MHASGSEVDLGTPLVRCTDPELITEAVVLKAKIKAMQREYRGFALREQVKRKILADEIAVLAAERDLAEDRIDALIIKSEMAGTFVVPDNVHLPGRFLSQGDIAGFVVSDSAMTIRTAINQDRIGLIRDGVDLVDVRFASSISTPHSTSVVRHFPASTMRLPSATLGTAGGGRLAVDGSDEEGTLLSHEVFLVDVAVPDSVTPERIGERVHVLFSHGRQSIAEQWERSLRLLFLRHFNV